MKKLFLFVLLAVAFIRCSSDDPVLEPPLVEKEVFTDTLKLSQQEILQILSNEKEYELSGVREFHGDEGFSKSNLGKRIILFTPDSFKIKNSLSYKITETKGIKIISNQATYYHINLSGDYKESFSTLTFYSGVIELQDNTLTSSIAYQTTNYKNTGRKEITNYFFTLNDEVRVFWNIEGEFDY